MLSVKYVFLIWQETNGGIVILKTVLKSDLWPGSEKYWFNPKFEDNDLKSGRYRVPILPLLSVKHVCPISQETNHPIMIPKIVLKSVLWRGSESARYFCIFQLLCFSLHPSVQCCEDSEIKSGSISHWLTHWVTYWDILDDKNQWAEIF